MLWGRGKSDEEGQEGIKKKKKTSSAKWGRYGGEETSIRQKGEPSS